MKMDRTLKYESKNGVKRNRSVRLLLLVILTIAGWVGSQGIASAQESKAPKNWNMPELSGSPDNVI